MQYRCGCKSTELQLLREKIGSEAMKEGIRSLGVSESMGPAHQHSVTQPRCRTGPASEKSTEYVIGKKLGCEDASVRPDH
jgi:hypothetical protein